MKNRTIIGIVCMILAVAMTFAIAPVVNRLTSDTTTVVRLKQEVGRGTKITEDQVETVKVKTDTELNRNMMFSIDIVPIPMDEAVREVENRLLGWRQI